MSSRAAQDAAPQVDDALRAFADAVSGVVGAKYPSAEATVAFEAPRRPEFGDFSTNVALTLAKAARRAPQELATELVAEAKRRAPSLDELFSSVEPVAGFINVKLSPSVWHAAIARILREGAAYGERPRNGLRVSLEFGS